MIQIRRATVDDAPAIAAIYADEVEHGTATFDTEPPPAATWEHKVTDASAGHHFLVAVDDAEVLGFAYSTTYRPRGAYAGTRETTIYLGDAATGRGTGRRLYDQLLAALRTDGIHTALAVVAVPNPASRALHRAMGFTHVGTLKEVGHKFGRWLDVEFWQLML